MNAPTCFWMVAPECGRSFFEPTPFVGPTMRRFREVWHGRRSITTLPEESLFPSYVLEGQLVGFGSGRVLVYVEREDLLLFRNVVDQLRVAIAWVDAFFGMLRFVGCPCGGAR